MKYKPLSFEVNLRDSVSPWTACPLPYAFCKTDETHADCAVPGGGYWGIENGLHYRRDDTLHEDRCRLKGQGAHVMAAINNLVLGLLRRRGVVNVPDARRYYEAHLEEAVALLLDSPT